MIKYIITGGAGFIGSHLVEKLIKQNKKVIVLDNLSTGRLENIKRFKKKIRFIKCDISKKGNSIKEFKGKCYVFHLASLADIVPSIQNPKKYFESNVNGTLNILEACRKAKIIKLIYSASSSCYGIPKTYPTKEFEKINPMYPYALTKKMGEDENDDLSVGAVATMVLEQKKLDREILNLGIRIDNKFGQGTWTEILETRKKMIEEHNRQVKIQKELDGLKKLKVQELHLEHCTLHYSMLDVFEKYDFKGNLSFGVVDQRTDELESVEEVHQRIKPVIEKFGADRIILSSECGFGHVPLEITRAKLSRLVEAGKKY